MNRACIIECGELFDYASKHYGISWNESCDLFMDYYITDGFTYLAPMCAPEDPAARDDIKDIEDDVQKASRIVEEFIETLDVPEGYTLLIQD